MEAEGRQTPIDVTEVLRRSEERYARAQRAANIGSWDWDIRTGDLHWSDRIEPLFGFAPGQFSATYEAFLECVHPDDRQGVVDSINASVEQGDDYAIEHRIVWPDGTVRWVSETGDVVRDEQGGAIRMLGIVQDITERREAEEALRASVERYRSYIEVTGQLGWTANSDGEVEEDIPTWRQFTGQSEEDVRGWGWSRALHPDDRERTKQAWRNAVETRSIYEVEYRIRRHDGVYRHFLVRSVPVIEEDGSIREWVGTCIDVTEHKRIEAHQQLAGQILKCLNREIAGTDLIRDVLKLIKRATGFDAVAIRQREGDDYPYLEVDGFPDDFVELENYLCRYDEQGELVCDAAGRPIVKCMCGNVLSGRADLALPFFTEGGSFWTNSTTELLANVPPEVLQVPARNQCNQAGYESVALIPLRSGGEIVGLLQLNDARQGRFTPAMIRFFEEIGTSIGIGMARIQAEREADSLARFPSENPNPVLRIARDGTVLYANAAASRLLENWRCKVGEQAPEHWRRKIFRLLESGLTENFEVTCKDRVLSLIMASVADSGYVNVYGSDITERKHAEADLREYRHHLEELVQTRTVELTQANEKLLQQIEERKHLEKEILNVSEREQRRIGRELHDSIGQQFTGIAFMMKVLEQKLADKLSGEAADAAEIKELVNQAMDQTRGLAKGLHPVDLDAGSLAAVLQELVASTEKMFGIRCALKCDETVPIDDTEVATHLYRITQEAITNAVKHGKAKNIRVELAYKKGETILTVENDGRDFPEEFESGGAGMGLQIMNHRADIIGASLDIRKAENDGTILICSFRNNKR